MSEGEVFDVAIVGYGPTGVVAAGLLGQAGLRVFACDRLTDVYEIPRAIAFDHEIQRIFQQLGVMNSIAPHMEPFTNSEFYGAGGQLIRRMTMVAPPYPQGHTPSAVFSQPPVERVLRARVAQLPNVQVALGQEVVGVTQDEQGVTLTLAGGRTIRARYAIACDGGASGVRESLGVELDDLDFDEPWLVVDVRVNASGLAKLPKTSVQYCEPERPCTLVIGPGNHRRWEISLNPGEDPKLAATDEGTWALLARWLTREDGTLWRQAAYRFHALVAREWRRGRIFLAGDAAHMQPPFLGQGMCQGLRDAANLSWKLIAVLRGEVGEPAPDAAHADAPAAVRGAAAQVLLDSYGIERAAHVRELTTRLKTIGSLICERDPVKARARDAKLLAECGGVVKDTPRQDVLPRLEVGLLASTASSGRGTLFPQPQLMRGRQQPRDTQGAAARTGVPGAELMDERIGYGWRLVLPAGAALPGESAWPATLRVLNLATEPEAEGVVAAWMRRHACCAALLRPDHYVFGTAAAAADIAPLLHEWRARLH